MTKHNEKGRFQSDGFRKLKESLRELAEMGIDPSREYSEDELAKMKPLQADFLRKIKLSRENKYSVDRLAKVQWEGLFPGDFVKKLGLQKPARHRGVLPEELETCNKTAAPTDDQDDYVSEPKWPDDLITLEIAVKKFLVSRSTLKRKIKQKKLQSYRPENCAVNHIHQVSEKEVGSFHLKR